MKRTHLATGLISTVFAVLANTASAAELPSTMTWTAYDVGSQGHSEASAIADAFGKGYNTRIRIQPAGSAIGRLQPLVSGRADYAYLATESFFATEGIYDFSERRWGPKTSEPSPADPLPLGYHRLPMPISTRLKTCGDSALLTWQATLRSM